MEENNNLSEWTIQFLKDCNVKLDFVGMEKGEAKYSDIYTYYGSDGRTKLTITLHYKTFDDSDREVFKDKIAISQKKTKTVYKKKKQLPQKPL